MVVSHLLSADLVCLVLDPYRLLSAPRIAEVLPDLQAKGSLHLVVNGELPHDTSEDQIKSSLLRQLDEIPSKPKNLDALNLPTISFVRATQALRALEALKLGLEADGSVSRARTDAFDTFQSQFLQSNVGPFQASLLSTVRALRSHQMNTASDTATAALLYISETISKDRRATRVASQTVTDLRHAAHQGGITARHASVVNRGIAGGTVEGDVEYEMNQARRDLEEGFRGRWAWLSLIGRLRVDDVGSEVSAYLERRFGRNLERQVSLICLVGNVADSAFRSSLRLASSRICRPLSPSKRTITSVNYLPQHVDLSHHIPSRLICCSTTSRRFPSRSRASRRHLCLIRYRAAAIRFSISPSPVFSFRHSVLCFPHTPWRYSASHRAGLHMSRPLLLCPLQRLSVLAF